MKRIKKPFLTAVLAVIAIGFTSLLLIAKLKKVNKN